MTAPAQGSPWIQSPRWDGLWMFAGLWAPAIALAVHLFLAVSSGDPQQGLSFGASIMGIAVIYLPLSVLHRISTTYTVLGLPMLRQDIRAHPMRYLYVPLAILLGSVGLSMAFVFHTSFTFMPGERGQLWAFFLLAYVMILWERWHFCAQEFGVLSIYRIRAKQFAPADKQFDRRFTVALMLGVNMAMYVALGFQDECYVLLAPTPLESCRAAWLAPVPHAAVLVGTVITLAALVREWRHPQRSVPKLWFYLLVGSHSWLLYAFPDAFGLFFLSYMFHHWMVAVGLFGRVTAASYRERNVRGLRGWWVPAAWLGLTLLLYIAFDPLDKAGNLAPVPDLRIFEGASTTAKLLMGTVIGTFFALNYLHYYYDRCFYRFTNPEVRKHVGPLLFGPAPGPSRDADAKPDQAALVANR